MILSSAIPERTVHQMDLDELTTESCRASTPVPRAARLVRRVGSRWGGDRAARPTIRALRQVMGRYDRLRKSARVWSVGFRPGSASLLMPGCGAHRGATPKACQ